MLILRIENALGVGCYSDGGRAGTCAAIRAHDFGDAPINYAHPTPGSDQLLAPAFINILNDQHPTIGTANMRFGFASPRQYHTWFHTKRSREILANCGMFARVYAVPPSHAETGNTQAIFAKTFANLVTQFLTTDPIEEMEEYWKLHS